MRCKIVTETLHDKTHQDASRDLRQNALLHSASPGADVGALCVRAFLVGVHRAGLLVAVAFLDLEVPRHHAIPELVAHGDFSDEAVARLRGVRFPNTCTEDAERRFRT